MSQENVEVAREVVDGFNAFMRGELTSEAAAEHARLDPQVELDWHDQRETPDTPQHVRGAQELIGFWERFRAAWTDLAWEPIEFTEAPGDRVRLESARPAEAGKVAFRWKSTFLVSGRSEMENCARSSSSAIAPMPSKPPGYRRSCFGLP